ncbi:MAG: hypothetical protein VX275_10230 [Pseudomonadota bacterium]|nr:hypothetical protein [Pseudomonadota bacterium]
MKNSGRAHAEIKSVSLEFSVLFFGNQPSNENQHFTPGNAVWYDQRTAPDIRLGDKPDFENGWL